jgi:hypothetical protein
MQDSQPQPERYARLARTSEQNIQGGNHVLYETLMFFNLAALLDETERWSKGLNWDTKTLYMALVESMLVHRRSLMDFYFPAVGYEADKRRDSDMFASDFCDSWRPARPASFKVEWNAISEEVLHLSYLRPEVASNWHYAEMRDELRELTKTFIDAADDRLHDYMKAQLREIAFGERRTGRALTPEVQARMAAVDPKLLSGLPAGLSTPTSTTLR